MKENYQELTAVLWFALFSSKAVEKSQNVVFTKEGLLEKTRGQWKLFIVQGYYLFILRLRLYITRNKGEYLWLRTEKPFFFVNVHRRQWNHFQLSSSNGFVCGTEFCYYHSSICDFFIFLLLLFLFLQSFSINCCMKASTLKAEAS